MNIYQRRRLIDAQIKYCEDNNYPMFMPKLGYCWLCARDIVPKLKDKMATELITGCPICHRSYCD